MDTSPRDPKLTWDDLILDSPNSAESTAWLSHWDWLLTGRLAPIFLSRFGDWFFHREDGTIQTLDVCEGTVETIAPDFATFQSAVNIPEWQERYLYSALTLKYRRQGIIARDRNAIGFAPHPAMVASLSACEVMVMPMNAWQSICGQTLRQLRGAK